MTRHSTETCEVCGERLLLDHDTDEYGKSYYTRTYCDNEYACEGIECTQWTHTLCDDCGLPICKNHAAPERHLCPIQETDA